MDNQLNLLPTRLLLLCNYIDQITFMRLFHRNFSFLRFTPCPSNVDTSVSYFYRLIPEISITQEPEEVELKNTGTHLIYLHLNNRLSLKIVVFSPLHCCPTLTYFTLHCESHDTVESRRPVTYFNIIHQNKYLIAHNDNDYNEDECVVHQLVFQGNVLLLNNGGLVEIQQLIQFEKIKKCTQAPLVSSNNVFCYHRVSWVNFYIIFKF
ncbi:hypothetical protein BDA99DRAFT_533710 [Phascolomyces articulosus]|uniref:Uncharacterized protein n=1 Tax=Phascolomyces articulosus TaxID=60185 RepID=A0AAD5KJL6_9FUNG|nr:hypothetical protein BDA99DRAFT_533710 [Phascolomyces articulosus]